MIYKKLSLVLITFFALISLFTKKAISQSVVNTAPPSKPLFLSKDSILCNKWQLVSFEEFGVINRLDSITKNDQLTFLTDGSFSITRKGVTENGKWNFTEDQKNIKLSIKNKEKETETILMLKILKLNTNYFQYEYQHLNLVRTVYNYKKL